ncbi:leucyl aminopeptidase family protein [Rathayibacter soli]|uniref:leucyl aminopeptidase family protein n=1 Tax=Rathayibacter soli TaxID=3144168 RepID=UPI0027E3B5F1|nr:M17 family peptidase N-terminal domain-containing protein [Glaciibacter superstes]
MRQTTLVTLDELPLGKCPVQVGLFCAEDAGEAGGELGRGEGQRNGTGSAGHSSGAGAKLVGGRGAEAILRMSGIDIAHLAAQAPGFTGAVGQSQTIVVSAADASRTTFVVIGLGAQKAFDATALRDASARSAGGQRSLFATTLALELDADGDSAVRAVVEGIGLGGYRYQAAGVQQTGAEQHDPAALIVTSQVVSDSVVRRARVFADAANWVRQLVETPSSVLGPVEFAAAITAHAAAVAAGAVTVSVWSRDQLSERGFAGTLGVGAGSDREPCVVELSTAGVGAPIALAGKGITFDSGGINLKKDPGELAWMKSDMAAGAAVAAAVIAAAALGAAVPMTALVPVAENMPGGGALRPGDVLTHPDGRTTEVVDTDCEGRLVLADAVAWLAKSAPRALIDVGTLTDSGGVGPALWGCWGTAPALAAEMVDAGVRAGEPGWQLPLVPSYAGLLPSIVADAANAPRDVPDSGQLAATFLRPFAGSTPWLHIDNGSGAYLEHDFSPWPAGATGSPVRALIEFLCSPTLADAFVLDT